MASADVGVAFYGTASGFMWVTITGAVTSALIITNWSFCENLSRYFLGSIWKYRLF